MKNIKQKLQPQSLKPYEQNAHTDKRMARATRNTRHCYNKIGRLDHNMADNRASPACTNTASSTTTKPIKTSNKSYSHNPLNCMNKMHTHDFIFNKSGKRGLRLSINRFVQPNHNQHNVQNITVTKTYIRTKNILPRPKRHITTPRQRSVMQLSPMVRHPSCSRADSDNKQSTNTTQPPQHTALNKLISTQNKHMKSAKQNTIRQSTDQHRTTPIKSKQWFTTIH